MHPDIRELLTLCDGAPVAAHIVQHTQACEQCGTELARLKEMGKRMRQLPAIAVPRHAWTAIEQALSLPEPAQARSRVGRAAVLVAGLLVVTLLSALLWQGKRDRPSANHPSIRADLGSVRPESLASLVARSQQLETLLRGLPRPALERAATAAVIDELQTRIQVLDVQLSGAEGFDLDRAQSQQLWAARVQLLNSLINVRYAERAARSDFAPPDSTGEI